MCQKKQLGCAEDTTTNLSFIYNLKRRLLNMLLHMYKNVRVRKIQPQYDMLSEVDSNKCQRRIVRMH